MREIILSSFTELLKCAWKSPLSNWESHLSMCAHSGEQNEEEWSIKITMKRYKKVIINHQSRIPLDVACLLALRFNLPHFEMCFLKPPWTKHQMKYFSYRITHSIYLPILSMMSLIESNWKRGSERVRDKKKEITCAHLDLETQEFNQVRK